MEETLVKFETANLARHKGFNEVCIDSFNGEKPTNRYDIGLGERYTIKDVQFQFEVSNSTLAAGFTARPTQSLLQKWLREVHQIDCTPVYTPTEKGELKYTDSVYSDLVPDEDIENEEACLPYEEALEIALKYALSLLPDWKP